VSASHADLIRITRWVRDAVESPTRAVKLTQVHASARVSGAVPACRVADLLQEGRRAGYVKFVVKEARGRRSRWGWLVTVKGTKLLNGGRS
jgi:hypothetical protein